MAYLDTHKEIQHLKTAGIPEKEAEAIVELHIKKNDELATKTDLQLLESHLNSSINNINTNMKWQTAMGLLILGLLIKDLFF